MKSKIAIFASGQGSNARRLLQYFKDHPSLAIDLIVCNRKEAGVYEVAEEFGIEILYIPKNEFEKGDGLVSLLKSREIDWVILAGFLLKLPLILIQSFPSKIINLHPSLLPKFGGKGMYGDHVHRAVLEKGESKSGISIHLVDENYDTGSMIAQFECEVNDSDEVQDLQKKIRKLEHQYYPATIEKTILQKKIQD